MSGHGKEILGGIALAGLGAATGGFGLLAAAPELAGLGAAAGSATGALGAGALGATGAGLGTAAAFGPEAGAFGAGLLGSAATPAMTAGLGAMDAGMAGMGGGTAALFGAAPGAAEALAFDPAANTGMLGRMAQFMGGDKAPMAMRGLGMMSQAMQPQAPQQQQAVVPPHAANPQQPIQFAGMDDPELIKRRMMGTVGFLNG